MLKRDEGRGARDGWHPYQYGTLNLGTWNLEFGI